MSQPGWIKIHRALLDHWSSSEPEALAVWIRMLCEANFEEKTTLIHGQLVTVKRGQLIFGLEKFSARSGVSIKKLRRIVDMLVSDGMLGRQVMQRFSMLTITCYDKYQDMGKQEASTGQAEGNRRATPKEGNNSRSEESIGDFQSPGNQEVASSKQKTKGSRITDEWEMPSDWIEWAVVEMSVLRNVAVSESGRFKDYWMSQPGSKGVKANWQATWRNWIRSAAERNPQIVKKSASPREFGA